MSKALVVIGLGMFIACHASRVNRASLNSAIQQGTESTEDYSDMAIAEDYSDVKCLQNYSIEESAEEFAEEYSDEEEGLHEESDQQAWGCKNYCVQCNDGSTVWYGRNKNWWKMGASVVLGSVGLAATGSGIGAVGAVAGFGAAGVLGHAQGVQSTEETHSHWSGNIPTTGFFCEKVDIFKFPKAQSCQALPFMEVSQKRFGRVKNNRLKPYDTKRRLMTEQGFVTSDMNSYKEGCKVVKAAGTKAFQQLSFGKFCKQGTTKGIHLCSTHSRLCGAAGVAGTNYAKSADQCQQQCQNGQPKLKCPSGASSFQQPMNQQPGYSQNGYQPTVNTGYMPAVNTGYQQPGYQQPSY